MKRMQVDTIVTLPKKNWSEFLIVYNDARFEGRKRAHLRYKRSLLIHLFRSRKGKPATFLVTSSVGSTGAAWIDRYTCHSSM